LGSARLEKEIELVTYGGNRKVHGFRNLVNGDTKNKTP